jgi:hypothetical protein
MQRLAAFSSFIIVSYLYYNTNKFNNCALLELN